MARGRAPSRRPRQRGRNQITLTPMNATSLGPPPGAREGYQIPPLGTFDPGLESQRRGSRRGLANLIEDAATAEQRETQDYFTQRGLAQRGVRRDTQDLNVGRRQGLQDIRRDASRGRQDIGFRRQDVRREFTRDLADLAIAKQRGEQDYERALGGLQRKYAMRAVDQAQQQNAAGVFEKGSAGAAAAAARAENQAYEQAPLDISRARLAQDLASKEGRTREDVRTSLGRLGVQGNRLGQDVRRGTRRLGLEYRTNRRRGAQDLATQLDLYQRGFNRSEADRDQDVSRATLEQGIFEQDITQQEYFQAHQYNPHIRFPSLGQFATGNYGPRGNPIRPTGRRRGRNAPPTP